MVARCWVALSVLIVFACCCRELCLSVMVTLVYPIVFVMCIETQKSAVRTRNNACLSNIIVL